MTKARRQPVSIVKRSRKSLEHTHPMTMVASATDRTERSSPRMTEGIFSSSRRPWRFLALTTMIFAAMVAQQLPVTQSLAFDGNPHHAATVLNDLHTAWQATAATHSSLPTLPEHLQHLAFLSKESLLLTSSSSGSSTTTMTLASTTTASSASFSLTEMNACTSTLFTRYRAALQSDPLVTKMATGMVLAVMGDGIAQSRKRNMDETYNVKRAGAFAAFDACWRAVQQWSYPPIYQICNGKFTVDLLSSLSTLSTSSSSSSSLSFSMPSTHLLAAWEQTLVSQLVLIPLLYYPVFYIVTSFVQSLTVEETVDRAKETFIPLMKRNLLFWIPVQFAVFGFVEEDFQIPILIVAGLAWTVILSLAAGGVSTSPKLDKTVLDDLGVENTMLQVDEVMEHSFGFNGTSFYAFSNATDVNFDVEVDMNVEEVSTIPTKNVLYNRESQKETADEAVDPIR